MMSRACSSGTPCGSCLPARTTPYVTAATPGKSPSSYRDQVCGLQPGLIVPGGAAQVSSKTERSCRSSRAASAKHLYSSSRGGHPLLSCHRLGSTRRAGPHVARGRQVVAGLRDLAAVHGPAPAWLVSECVGISHGVVARATHRQSGRSGPPRHPTAGPAPDRYAVPASGHR